DHKFGRYTLSRRRCRRFAVGRWQQCLGRQCAGVAILEEGASDVGEHSEGEDVLLGPGDRTDCATQVRHLGSEEVRGPDVDDLLIADGLAADGVVDFAGRLAVAALEIELYLVRDRLVALATEDVVYGLRTDDLRRRCDKWRVAEVGAYARD